MTENKKESEKESENDSVSDIKYPSSNVVMEAVFREYEYESDRVAKLDSKINITVTLCGVLFIFILKYLDFDQIFYLIKENNNWQMLIGIMIAIGSILIIILYVYSLITLVSLLKASGYKRFEQEVLFEKNIVSEPKDIAETYIAALYNGAIYENSIINNERCVKYNKAICALEMMIAICMVIEFIKNLI